MIQESFSIEHHGMTLRGTQYLPVLSQALSQRVPTVVMLHGFAGHRIGPAAMFVQIARALNEQGIAAISFDMRNSGESDGSFDQMLVTQELDDVLRVTEWAQRQTYVDRSRLGVFGFSLGGLLSGCAIGQTRAYRAAVLAAPTTVQNMARHAGESEGARAVVGPTPLHADFFTDIRTLDPLGDIARHPIPIRLILGAGDTAAPPAVSDAYTQAIRSAGEPVDVQIIADANHTFSQPAHRAALVTGAVDWFVAHL